MILDVGSGKKGTPEFQRSFMANVIIISTSTWIMDKKQKNNLVNEWWGSVVGEPSRSVGLMLGSLYPPNAWVPYRSLAAPM